LPIKPVYANNNTKYLNRVQDGQAMNPVAISNSDLTGYAKSENTTVQTNFELSYVPPFLKDLELKGVVAYDRRFYYGKQLQKNYYLYDYDPDTDSYLSTGFQSPSKIGNSFTNYYYTTIQAQANYKKTIAKDHNVAATLVFERKESISKYNSISKYFDFLTNDQVDYASEENATSSGNESRTRNMSYLGKVNYDYKGKYLLEFAARYDGSYRYHPDVRWGFFPVLSLGYRISEEPFFKRTLGGLISNLKIRGSIGEIGQDTGNAFQYISAFTTSGGGWYEFTDGKMTNGVSSPALVNERMTWTTNKMKDVGFDIGLFNNKLNMTFDLFRKDVEGILAYRNVTLPNTFGGTFPQENLNSTRTDGFEASFGYQNMLGDVLYNISGNFTYGRTKNMYIEHSEYTSSWNEYRNATAYRWNDISWGYNVIGQFKSEEEILNAPIQGGSNGNKYVKPGDWIYEDVDGNGVIDSNDMVPINYNSSTPKMNYGLTLGASYKGFDLSMLFQGAAQFSVRYTHAYTTMFWQEGNIPAYFMDRWHRADAYDDTSEWVAGKWPSIRLTNYVGQLYAESNAWRKSCSYIRLKNIELSYTFQQKFIKKAGLDKLRVFASAYNVFTICDSFVKAFDPESVATSNGYASGWIYPLMRTYTLGLNINF
jgi:TonB-linked SusC/RagA family outer membrane protein